MALRRVSAGMRAFLYSGQEESGRNEDERSGVTIRQVDNLASTTSTVTGREPACQPKFLTCFIPALASLEVRCGDSGKATNTACKWNSHQHWRCLTGDAAGIRHAMHQRQRLVGLWRGGNRAIIGPVRRASMLPTRVWRLHLDAIGAVTLSPVTKRATGFIAHRTGM